MAPKTNFASKGDKSRARNAANSGHSATIREISVHARLRGGAGRTRTSNQTIISSWLAKCPKCRGFCVRALCLRKQPIEFQWNNFGGFVSANKNSVSSHGDHRSSSVLPPGSSDRAKVAGTSSDRQKRAILESEGLGFGIKIPYSSLIRKKCSSPRGAKSFCKTIPPKADIPQHHLGNIYVAAAITRF